MLFPYNYGTRSGNPGEAGDYRVGEFVLAQDYARHKLKTLLVFWGAVALISAAGLYMVMFDETSSLLSAGLALALGVLFAGGTWRAGRALRDLMGDTLAFEARIAETAFSLSVWRLFLAEDRFYVRLERPLDNRPLLILSDREVRHGWFLIARGFFRILEVGDRVRGTLYPHSRVIASVMKL